MTRERSRLQDALTGALSDVPEVVALFLSGSLARGEGDDWSDLDFVAVVRADDADALVARFRKELSALAEVVMFRTTDRWPRLVNAITGAWQRIDVLLLDEAALAGRPADDLAPLYDPGGLHDGLPRHRPSAAPRSDALAGLIEEFIRVHGLLAVAAGRGEWVTGISGWTLQREALIRLMRIDAAERDTGGVLHLSRILPASDMAVLAALPSPAPNRGSLLAAHAAVAREFLPRARAVAARAGVVWPEAFERATEAYLARALGPLPEVNA